MGTKSTLGYDSGLSNHTLRDASVVTIDDDSNTRLHSNLRIAAASDDRHDRLQHTPPAVLAHWQLSWDTRGSFGPGDERPGILSDSATVSAQQLVLHLEEEDTVKQEKETDDDFHDSDAEDVYDLYLSVNGALHNGLLDIRKLNELNDEEAKILNVPRLKEIWKHTETGCLKCKEIIRTLNIVRNVLQKETNDEITAQTAAVDQVDSILN